MSDFLYSSETIKHGEMSGNIRAIYRSNPPDIYEYHGKWGSLAVSHNLYNGFVSYENEQHIVIVIGGPVLTFQLISSESRYHDREPDTNTRAIYERWHSGNMRWDEDLSGPFVVVIIDKQRNQILLVTDMMMFIPVYVFEKAGKLMLGTHVDVLARSVGGSKKFDSASLVDFVLNDVITYPYTAYENIRQCHPAAVYEITWKDAISTVLSPPTVYWLPQEDNSFNSIDDAADALRASVTEFIKLATDGMTHVAQFISAGEDSRAIAGMLPQEIERDAFIFLDSMNREGRIARRVAHAYNARFHVEHRNSTHYLDILSEASDLVGAGHQFHHAHTLGFHTICKLSEYQAVFGGYASDSLHKSYFARKYLTSERLPFIPDISVPGEARSLPLEMKLFPGEILRQIDERRQQQLRYLKQFRRESVHEWFVLWPATMRAGMPNLHCNRRLFRSYEPFMCSKAVKISAAVPTVWKLNRRLFNKAFRRYLKPSQYIFHADGRLPYYPWWVNCPLQFVVWGLRKIGTHSRIITGNQGPWGDWHQIEPTQRWRNEFVQYITKEHNDGIFTGNHIQQVLETNDLCLREKVNYLQMLHHINS